MFDIHEYYIEQQLLDSNNSRLDPYDLPPISALEQDIFSIIKHTPVSLYSTLTFKKHGHTITMYSPNKYCPFSGEFTINPDYFRFLLSVYPDFSDLNNISHLIFRPRFVESNNIQLVALYSPGQKSLLLYFSYPHTYSFNDHSFFNASSTDFDIASITDPHYLGTAAGGDETILTIPPLFYIIKMIAQSTNITIDKYLLKLNSSIDAEKLLLLDEISFFYRQHGY